MNLAANLTTRDGGRVLVVKHQYRNDYSRPDVVLSKDNPSLRDRLEPGRNQVF